MDLITIFNYENARVDTNEGKMLIVWISQAVCAKRECPDAINKIRIISHPSGLHESLRKLIEDHVEIETLYEPAKPVGRPTREWHLSIFKLAVICNQNVPFVFLDADAIIISPHMFQEVIDASKSKPLIMVNHQSIPVHTTHIPYRFANTGFLIVSDPSFLNIDTVKNTPLRRPCPGDHTDQIILWNYCMNMRYDYTHPKIHYGWNACAGYKKILDTVRVVSSGIAEESDIHILHYWDEFKPWITPCPIYKRIYNHLKLE